MEVGGRQGKTPILVKDVPGAYLPPVHPFNPTASTFITLTHLLLYSPIGFFVNRCLAPFMVEVTALVAEGVDLQHIDKAMKLFGMPVGPITLSGQLTNITAQLPLFLASITEKLINPTISSHSFPFLFYLFLSSFR